MIDRKEMEGKESNTAPPVIEIPKPDKPPKAEKQQQQRPPKGEGQQQQQGKKEKGGQQQNQEGKPEKQPQQSSSSSSAASAATAGKDNTLASEVFRLALFDHLPRKQVTRDPDLIEEDRMIHPATIQLGLLYHKGVIQSDDDRAHALISTLMIIIQDYKTPPKKVLREDMDKFLGKQVSSCSLSLSLSLPLALSTNQMDLTLSLSLFFLHRSNT